MLLFACVHDLLLAGPPTTTASARYYPNLDADPAAAIRCPAFRAFCAAHRDELAELLATRSTQTNEIGRCALLLPAFGLVAAEVGPLAHLDVGTSAGLNLLLDRYHYRYEPGGERRRAVARRADVRHPGRRPDPRRRCPRSSSGSGSTAHPSTSTTTSAARWLEACVWPDQTDRFERLRAALGIARDDRRRRPTPATPSPTPPRSCVGAARPPGRDQHVGAQLPVGDRAARPTSPRSTRAGAGATCRGCSPRARSWCPSCPPVDARHVDDRARARPLAQGAADRPPPGPVPPPRLLAALA